MIRRKIFIETENRVHVDMDANFNDCNREA